MIMSKKDNRSEVSGLLELTDVELEVVYGGISCYPPYDDGSDYYSSYDSYRSTDYRSNNGVVNLLLNSQNNDNSRSTSLLSFL